MPSMTRVRTVFTGVAGTPWYSNLYFDGTGDDEAYTDVVGDFWTLISDVITAGIHWEVEGTVTHMDVATGTTTGVGSGNSHTGNGSNAGAPLPYANQMLGNLHTGQYVGGRELRGKIFIPGLPTGALTGVNWSPTFRGEVEIGLDNIRTAVFEPDNFWLVWSRKHGVAYPVTGNPVSSTPAVLRSRRD